MPTSYKVALETHFPLRRAQFVLAFLLKSNLFCKVFGGVGTGNKFATSLVSLFSQNYKPSLLYFSFLLQLLFLTHTHTL